MAYWITQDLGFAGTNYKCSRCHGVFIDSVFHIDDICPKCGAKITAVVNSETFTDLSDIHMLTNKEAANIISNMVRTVRIGRGSTKSMTQMRILEALCKAVKVLENTPDEE